MNYITRLSVIFLVMVACLVAVNISFAAEAEPTGTVSIKSTSVAIGVGINWGDGTLKFEDKEYKFKINGLSVVDLGISSVEASGEVYNLQKLSDFAGTYSAASAGIDVAVGGGATAMQNENKVVIKLKSTKEGIQFTLAAGGASIKLAE